MDKAEGFYPEAHTLIAVKVDTWGSFIFINLNPNSEPLAVQLGKLSGVSALSPARIGTGA